MTSANPVGAMAPGFTTVGQHVARRSATRLVTRAALARPLLVHGPAGAGKGMFVADLVALLLCRAPDPESGPCNACDACRRARAGSHADVVIASPETWAATRGTNESLVSVARRWILEIAGAPIDGERRIVVIEALDRCNESIQNALLKALEEPSPRHVFVLVADDADRVLPTIRSRCQPLRIGVVPRADLAAWIAATHSVAAREADAVARLSGGRIGLATYYLGRPDLRVWRSRLQAELLNLLTRGRAERFAAVRDALSETAKVLGEDAGRDATDGEAPPTSTDGAPPARTPAARQRAAALAIIDVWLALARDVAVAAAGRPTRAAANDQLPKLAETASRVGARRAAVFVRRLESIREGLAVNVSPRLALEVAMLEWPALEPAAA